MEVGRGGRGDGVAWMAGKHYITRDRRAVATWLGMGEVVKGVCERERRKLASRNLPFNFTMLI